MLATTTLVITTVILELQQRKLHGKHSKWQLQYTSKQVIDICVKRK